MKFPIEHKNATVRDDQKGVRKCYLNSIRKAEPWDVNVVLMDVDIVDALGDQNFDQEDVEMSDSLEQVVMIDELNPHIIESES